MKDNELTPLQQLLSMRRDTKDAMDIKCALDVCKSLTLSLRPRSQLAQRAMHERGQTQMYGSDVTHVV